MAVPPIDVKLVMSKIAVGAPLRGGEFHFAIFDQNFTRLYTATNDDNGLITFPALRFSSPGAYHYTVREYETPDTHPDWQIDMRVWPVEIDVTHDIEENELHAVVAYPEGTPVFINVHRGTKCGLVEFPELTFTEPGIYEYELRELTPSGEGWTTDPRTIKVIVIVMSDGHGNLVATIEYPEGFPSFTNIFKATPARIIISACKIAIGAPLPAGRFEFGLFDEQGRLIHTAKNGPADETFQNPPGDDDDDN